MRIILDTNILLASIARKSKFRLIFDKLIAGDFTLIVSNEIISEYQEIIEQKTNAIIAANIIEMILSLENVIKQDVYFQWNMIDIDKDDNKFTDCAVAGNADYLVTNDKHFNGIKDIEFPKLELIDIYEFISILQKK